MELILFFDYCLTREISKLTYNNFHLFRKIDFPTFLIRLRFQQNQEDYQTSYVASFGSLPSTTYAKKLKFSNKLPEFSIPQSR